MTPADQVLHIPKLGKENRAKPVKREFPRSQRLRPRNGNALRQIQNQIPGHPNDACKAPTQSPRAPAPSPKPVHAADMTPAYRAEAAKLDDLRFDNERIMAYVAARSNGASPEQARVDCKYGMHYVKSSAAKRAETLQLLRQYGLTDCSLSWPRHELKLDCKLEQCPVLGKGSANKVYAISMNGREYAFKPALGAGKQKISYNGALLGLEEKNLHPELRYLAAVRIADSLDLMGADGVVNPACMAIVNGVPGILTPRVKGKPEAKDNLWQHRVSITSAQAQKVSRKALAMQADSEEQFIEAARAVGLYMVDAEGDKLLLSGTLGRRSKSAAARYASPDYNLQAYNYQVFANLANLCDVHSGNLLVEKLPAGKFRLKGIDLDEALAPKRPDQLKSKYRSGAKSWIQAPMSRQVLCMPARLRQSLQSQRCQALNANLRQELKDYLPRADLDALAEREQALRESEVPDYDPRIANWQPGRDLAPQHWLLDSMIGFSEHEFGDSDDSSSVEENLGAPQAKELG